MQALILVGGEGTRLRPLTSRIAKPVVTLVDRPFIAYMLEWLRRHGVTDVVLSCGFLADGVRAELGDGERFGLTLHYVEEPEPLGTGGAVRYAADLLRERFLVCNGDILTDIDLGAQLAQHERTGAVATLALIAVEDPSAYGLVRCDADGTVLEFIEKPSPALAATTAPHVSAGAYVLERSVLDLIAPGRAVSLEREIWPALIGKGLYGHLSSGYWLDIGTPERYLQATFDILSLAVKTDRAPSHHLPVIGAHAQIGAGAIVRDSIIAERASIGPHTELEGGVVIGEDAHIGERQLIAAGARIEPGARV